MSLTFYYAPMSTASITRLVLEELEVPFGRVKIDLQKAESHTPAFLTLNPNGKVPVLVHDGVALWESAAITLYLGDLFGVDRQLYPAPGPRRGEAMKWIVWANVTLSDAVSRWARNIANWVPPDQQNAKAGEAGRLEMHHCIGILDSALAARPFLVDAYTLADTHLNSFVDWLRHMAVGLEPYPHLNAWSERCRARPAYLRVAAERE